MPALVTPPPRVALAVESPLTLGKLALGPGVLPKGRVAVAAPLVLAIDGYRLSVAAAVVSADTLVLALGAEGAEAVVRELLMAASIHVLLPLVVLFLVGQKFFVKGIVMTGGK